MIFIPLLKKLDIKPEESHKLDHLIHPKKLARYMNLSGGERDERGIKKQIITDRKEYFSKVPL